MERQKRIILIGLVIVGFVVFAFNLNGPLFWDDDDWIVANPVVHEPFSHFGTLAGHDILAGIGQSSNYYRPLLVLSFAFNWEVSGPSGWSYHLVSNFLHIGSAVLLFLLFDALFGNRYARLEYSRSIAAVAALFWLLHPVQPESVAYISGRGDPLSLCLMLLSILLFLRGRGWWLVGSLAAAVLALLSRETAVLLPAYLVIVLMTFVHREPLWSSLKRSLRDVLPFIALSGVYVLLRLTVLNLSNTLNWHRFDSIYTESVFVRIWTFLSALYHYVRLTLVPVGLHMEHSIPVQPTPWHWTVIAGTLLFVAASAWVVIAWRKGNRLPFFGVMMFLVPLAPSSGIIAPINSVFYEHWLYVSLIGGGSLLAFYGVCSYEALRKRSGRLGIVLFVMGIAYLSYLAGYSILRNRIWAQPERLYGEVLRYEPDNVRVLNNLANIFADRDENERAEEYWTRAVEADPTQPAPYHNLGNLARDRGDIELAEELYLKAVNAQPTFHYAYRNLTGILLSQERYADAVQVLVRLRDLAPQDPAVHYTLAQALHLDGRDDLARQALSDGRRYAGSSEALRAYDQLEAQLQ